MDRSPKLNQEPTGSSGTKCLVRTTETTAIPAEKTVRRHAADSVWDPATRRAEQVVKPAENPETTRQRLRILDLRADIWSMLTVTRMVLLLADVIRLGWAMPFALAAGYMNITLGIFNCRRILAGKKPW